MEASACFVVSGDAAVEEATGLGGEVICLEGTLFVEVGGDDPCGGVDAVGRYGKCI